MKRAFLIVIDALGIGAMPDAEQYGDVMQCNTLVNVAREAGGLNIPNLDKLGLGRIDNIRGVKPVSAPLASFGKMLEVSEGKDTTTGHWELAGIILDKPFKTYPDGFPRELIECFIQRTNCGGILGNIPASGTAIINDLGDSHRQTGFPIIYTSADSVFQIACHIDTTPLKKLYEWCTIAREILTDEYNVSRVIARPFEGESGNYKRISAARKDYSVLPTKPTILNALEKSGAKVIGVGKIEDIFVKSGLTHSIHTGCNKEGIKVILELLKGNFDLNKISLNPSKDYSNAQNELIFVNLVDTDMLFGHRNDVKGYAKALEEIDTALGQIIEMITPDDLLIITADHGCDPTVKGTDHTREMVPILVYNPKLPAKDLGLRKSFADVAVTLADWFGVEYECGGISLLN